MPDQDFPLHSYSDQDRGSAAEQHLQLPAIVSGTVSEYHGRPEQHLAATEAKLVPLYQAQIVRSASSIEPNAVASELFRMTSIGNMAQHPGHFGADVVHNSKRAYRQRRKNPSCDACRERKVKCDATETTSCAECSSRNVRCQFTKDTNRRMSSIKQVQDLERQLSEARFQLERLRMSEQAGQRQGSFSSVFLDPVPDIPDVGRSPRRMLKARPPQDFSSTRAQLSDVGRGIVRPPIAPSTPDNPDRRSSPLSSLPPRDVAQHCLETYLECVHRRIPVLYWPHFLRSFWSLYHQDTGPQISRETIALSFAVLAVGAVFSQEPRIRDSSGHFASVAFSFLDFWVDRIGIEQGLCTLLISIYMVENNTKVTGWVWLGSAIRIAQDRGLHVQGGYWSSIEGEMRKRIWYSLYIWDRLLATEVGRPMLINDDDCDTEYPEVLEEEKVIPGPFHPQRTTVLLASIHVARLLAPLVRLCRSLCITADAIKKFEAHLVNCMRLFPPELQLSATTPLDPLIMGPLLHFQNARILLYRHNMSPACSSEQRTLAIDNCTAVAQDTASVVSRCLLTNAPAHEAEGRLRSAGTSLTCTHLWRCMLFLAFRRSWQAFHVLLRVADLISNSKAVNISCGRHLTRFLEVLRERHLANLYVNLEEDEELIVLLSGDLQSGTSSWVWGNTETGTLLSRRQKHSRTTPTIHEAQHTPAAPTPNMTWDHFLSHDEIQSWGGWRRVAELAQWLEHAQRSLVQPQGKLLISPKLEKADSPPDLEPGASTSRSRMAIASITDL